MPESKVNHQKTKVAIVASGPTMMLAPFGDPSFEIWALNAAHRQFDDSKVSAWFQMHTPGSGDGHIDDDDHKEWLGRFDGCPIYMQKTLDWVPQSIAYPFEEVVASVCPHQAKPYFTNTVDYMVALAVHSNPKEIWLFGVDMVLDEDNEYHHHRPSVSYYLGVAAGRGIGVHIPDESALLKATHIYGYEPAPEHNSAMIKILQKKISAVEEEKAIHEKDQREALAKLNGCAGYIAALKSTIKLLELRDRGSQI